MYIRYGDSSTVRNNIITENSALWGGGIFCRGSRSLIGDNLITNNSAASNGGGLLIVSQGRPTVEGNIISGNSAGNSGGGVKCSDHSNPLMLRNLIVNNSAVYRGGGVRFSGSDAVLINNTFSGNRAESGGGISCLDYSTVTMTSCILWGDSAPYNAEIDVDLGGELTSGYCDIQGGWPGAGNIDADPIFAGPYNQDFYLRWRSPCIDAGDPSPIDPDGTRSDMGAFYFNKEVSGIIELYPHNTPIVIPPEGGEVLYDGWVFNFSGRGGRADIWSYVFAPELGRYGPINLYENVGIPVDSLGKNQITEHVRGTAPAGDYLFVAYVGDYPGTIIDSSYFYFAKASSIVPRIPFGKSKMVDWSEDRGRFEGVFPTESHLPGDYALSENYPNPFNAATVVNYRLPVAAHVKLEIFNILGQKVATLVDQKQKAGYRSASWDSSAFSSGQYFYRLTAGGFTETRRMTRVR